MSSTSLQVAWTPPPRDQVNGILLGYNVTYKKAGETSASEQYINTTFNFTVLSGLEKFAVYEVTVSAFTKVGRGPAGNINASTDQDGKSQTNHDIEAN